MSDQFTYNQEELKSIAQDTVILAKKMGADEVSINISEAIGLSVNVRNANPEQSEYAHDNSLNIALSINKKNGNASTNDLTQASIKASIQAALDFAKHTSIDEYSGLPEKKDLASEFRNLELFHPWDISISKAIEFCQKYEALALTQDSRIKQAEGFQLSSSSSQTIYANSLDFVNSELFTYHNIACALIAEDKNGMQRDFWVEDSRLALSFDKFAKTAITAAKRTVRRLEPKKITTGNYPVIFENTIANGLISALVAAISGSALYRQTTFLPDSIGKLVMNRNINIYENPFILREMASKNCDNEGVAVKERQLINCGELQGYFLGSYSARKLKMKTTGNSGGHHNLEVVDVASNLSTDEIINSINKGFLITETLGHGINMVTGDYSVGACGFLIENGKIAHPVEEVTIAGNLKDMFINIKAISSDGKYRGGIKCGAILIEPMTVASN